MAKWGKADFGELKKLAEKTEKLGPEMEQVLREVAEEVSAVLLKKVRKRTPVGVKPKIAATDENDRKALGGVNATRTYKVKGASGKSRSFLTREGAIFEKYWSGYVGGNLRKSWSVSRVQKLGNCYFVTVTNNAEYASYVEYGHRQRPGRFVPALGKRLKVSFVPGKYMLHLSVKEVEKAVPKALERAVNEKLREVFGGD